MYRYHAKQTIVDMNEKPIGFELFFRDGLKSCFPNIDADVATCRLLSSQFFYSNVPASSEGLSFINFPYQCLISGLAELLPKENTVIEILETCIPDDALFNVIEKQYQAGYHFALDDFMPSAKWEKIYPFISFIKFDIRQLALDKIPAHIQAIKAINPSIIFIAEKVETLEEFEHCKAIGFDLFQGYYFGKPVNYQSIAQKASLYPLVVLGEKITDSHINYQIFNYLIRYDFLLSYQFVYFMNTFGQTSHSISDFDEAIDRLKATSALQKYLLLILFPPENKQDIQKFSDAMQRAKFCELIAKNTNLEVNKEQAFMLGLYSILHSFMTQEIQAQLPNIKTFQLALFEPHTTLGQIMLLCSYYEKDLLDTPQAACLLERLSLSAPQIIQIGQISKKWAQYIPK